MKIFAKDIKEKPEFTFEGDILKRLAANEENNTYLYGRYHPNGKLYGYELVNGVKHKQPDGNYVYTYPSSE